MVNPEVPSQIQSENDVWAQLKRNVTDWSKQLKNAAALVSEPPESENEPFKNIYQAISKINSMLKEVEDSKEDLQSLPLQHFWIKFTLIHIHSSLAKWNEACEELSAAEQNHVKCIAYVEDAIASEISDTDIVSENVEEVKEFQMGLLRCKYMLIYELTRYAILCSERDNQDKALGLLKRAEVFYHGCESVKSSKRYSSHSILGMLDSLNSESISDMFTYVMFYLGQAYRIKEEKEKAVIYLHMVLRRQLEKGDFKHITWAADASRMASVLVVNMQAFETARNILVAATAVLSKTPEEEKSSDHYKQNWADLGRTWAKLGVELLEASADRLKDLEEQTRKPPKYNSKIILEPHEKLSLEISDPQEEFHTILLIKALSFPTVDLSEVEENQMRGRFVRDFDEARAVFLPLQRWINVAKEYYILDEFAGDYIDIISDYSNAFKHLSFFEPSLERQIKMQRRRIGMLEELLAALNPKPYLDVFHYLLRVLSETYEIVYKLKAAEIKDRGESLRPKDKKLVKWLTDAVDAHKRNLANYEFDVKDTKKDFPQEYEKTLLGCVLSIGRIFGSISHDHPLHEDAIAFAEEGKQYYEYFLQYLDRRPQLKEEFKVLYDGSQDIPELMDGQIRKIRHRMNSLNLL